MFGPYSTDDQLEAPLRRAVSALAKSKRQQSSLQFGSQVLDSPVSMDVNQIKENVGPLNHIQSHIFGKHPSQKEDQEI